MIHYDKCPTCSDDLDKIEVDDKVRDKAIIEYKCSSCGFNSKVEITENGIFGMIHKGKKQVIDLDKLYEEEMRNESE